MTDQPTPSTGHENGRETGHETVAEGVARVPVTTEPDFRAAVEALAVVVERALAEHHRVETLVALDDEHGQRVATWAGLRREGVLRGLTVDGRTADRIVYSRLADDPPVSDPEGFRSLLNSFLPRKRAISQMLVRDPDGRVLMCHLTYKRDWDLPGGVVEVGESPQLAVAREVREELGLALPSGPLLLTDWLPPWGGWDDALCLVFDGGVHPSTLLETMVRQEREIRTAAFLSLDEVRERAADFTARRVEAALSSVAAGPAAYAESGRRERQ
ncbi:NUDIX hydrolase [Nocardioides guangzhouensis]|uniref:NUDIX hydrolase n=1 Tax=Nocardioides guangzhouensis TaxID=2497878 RepID=A0A4Q4ZEJ8_9ACTN|nr:NUDIX hydrolase [Nocardioides guangzhouensis]RYP86487.1 NUDIX hydrolase [Nocardioides guangzhouensis]